MARHRSWLNLFGLVCLLSIFTVSLSNQATVAAQTKTCAKSLAPRLIVGGYGRVTDGNANNVRNEASTGDAVGQIRSGETFEVLDGPICADGEYWWRVHYSDFVGWTAEAQDSNYWLTPYVPHFKLATENHAIQVTYDDLHFEVSTSLTNDVNYHFELAQWNSEIALAEHVCFHLRLDADSQESPNNQLCLIKTSGMDEYVYELQQILSNKPPLDVPDGRTTIPVPFASAIQLMQARLNYISTDNLQGVSFITRYAPTDYKISGDTLKYNFAGLTQDGQFIVFFEYAAHTNLLPVGPPTNAQLSAVRENPLNYYKTVVDTLNQGTATDFTPNLDKLDAIINSIVFQ